MPRQLQNRLNGRNGRKRSVKLDDAYTAYHAALAHRDELMRAYSILRSYAPTPFGDGRSWQFERTVDSRFSSLLLVV
jgi:hypothetical protein